MNGLPMVARGLLLRPGRERVWTPAFLAELQRAAAGEALSEEETFRVLTEAGSELGKYALLLDAVDKGVLKL